MLEKMEVGGLDNIDIIYTFGQKEYVRAVQQYLLASRIIKKRDFFIMPLLAIVLLAALFYTHFNHWVLLLVLLCLAAILLGCYLFFFKPWYDYHKKPALNKETTLSFFEEGLYMGKQEEQEPEQTRTLELNLKQEQKQESEQEQGPQEKEPQEQALPEQTPAQEPEMEPQMQAPPEQMAQEQEQKEEPQEQKRSWKLKSSRQGQHTWISWDMFAEAWENREFFYLVQGTHRYTIVPKRAFANQEEQQYFLKMLYRRVGIVENVSP